MRSPTGSTEEKTFPDPRLASGLVRLASSIASYGKRLIPEPTRFVGSRKIALRVHPAVAAHPYLSGKESEQLTLSADRGEFVLLTNTIALRIASRRPVAAIRNNPGNLENWRQ